MPSFTPDRDHERPFRDALGLFATGVTVVTTHTANGLLGLTANSFAAVSLDPPLVLWSPARRSSRFGAFAAANRFAIHILGEGQGEVCRHFARRGDFRDVAHRIDADGVPLLPDSVARFDCARHAVHDGGDHLIIVARVLSVEVNVGAPLVFHAGQFVRLN